MSISKQILEKIASFSERLGIPEEELKQNFLQIKEELRALMPDLSERRLENKAYKRFRGNLRREYGSIYSSAPVWTGILFGYTEVIDFVELMKRKAIRLWENPETRDWAIENMLVTRDGTPLDPRETIFGKENPNFGRPFKEDEHSYYRAFFGVCSKGTSFGDDLQFFRLNINGDNALEVDYSLWTPVQFRGNIRRKTEYPFLDLNAISKQPVEFKIVEVEEIPDILEVLEFSEWPPRKITELPDLWDQYCSNDQRVPILLEGDVLDIRTTEKGNRLIYLDDEDLDWDEPAIRCLLPGDFPINFGIDSRVIFVGTVNHRRDDSDDYWFSAWGYYAPEKYLIPGG